MTWAEKWADWIDSGVNSAEEDVHFMSVHDAPDWAFELWERHGYEMEWVVQALDAGLSDKQLDLYMQLERDATAGHWEGKDVPDGEQFLELARMLAP